MATILIVEDEVLIADEIQRALIRLGHNALEPVDNSDDALATLAEQQVELVLMDVNIQGDTDGIATAILVRRQFAIPVVFLTARSDSATLNRAKVAQPFGFLLKPFTDDSLRAQLEMALYNAYEVPPPRTAASEEMATSAPNTTQFARHFFVRHGSGHVRIAVSDILYFEALQNYVRLHTATSSYVFDSTLKELEQKLPPCFFKTHRSHIVNLDHVQAYVEGCVLLGKEYIPVSRACKEELKNRIHLLG
ncbi:LytTR family transcriptional regulator DNA-binding domain-containing protein [Hymenobacter sp. YC55]|uniref:LytR/AlgR family response regulator transcription factor n=1 Tax=Hymenobacter sp. YC55 TaxID=3034019 RepID=UPI0023FA2251|nr:LytTR family transcriptional regulator DNA-binding domain-containing protein [Hymenobacter sp. YC55]MDF7815513.1 LytTR family transcriptional regulator DNA-binding domain-containing protein [Hymenobacter sp. YC55]